MSPLTFLLLLLLKLKVTDTATDTWRRHCTDLPPLDLLSFVLEKDTSKPLPGVRTMKFKGSRGVHFSRPHPSLSFPSSQLLANCDLFPSEFSIVVTFKLSHISRQRNEYIFSLVGGNKRKDAEKEAQLDEEAGEKKKGRQSRGARGPVILGLRFSRNRLHFLFRGQAGVTEHWGFRGVRLAHNRWHTLALAVRGRHAKLTVDCSAPVEMVASRPFPSELKLQRARFHLGSRGRWKGLFSGLLRQLVLVPGSDVTPQLCPSPGASPTDISVPPVLLDLSVKAKEVDTYRPRYEPERKISVGRERTCSEPKRGQLWFSPLRKGLYLCDGASWVPILEEHKHLDYIVEHQVLSTKSETYDVEVFHVPDMGLMAAMAHRASGSAVYLWRQDGFHLYQNISTYGALSWRHFSMGKKMFLVVSNSVGVSGQHVAMETGAEMSVIYKWSKRRKQFVTYQTLQTYCARDWEAFLIDGHAYLAVANHRRGDNNHTIDSVVYKWHRGTKSFEVHQTLQTSGAYDWEFFSVGPYHFLVVANAFDGVTTDIDSVIYVWIDGSFTVFQTIKTFCATDWEMFQIGNRVFLVVANGNRLHGNGSSRYTINSTIYELDMSGQIFVRFQDIVTYSAVDWEFFSLGEESFLIVANSFDGDSYSLNSVLYRWQGYEGFVPVHWLPTIGCSDWEFFTSGEESYLIYSSAKAPLSKVFKLKTH